MKALGITPRSPRTARLVDLPTPTLDEVPNGRGVLVKVLQVGVDGTDKELHLGEYGAAPDGYDFLVTGHESLGRVLAVGPNVTELRPGDYVVATVRRPGHSLYDQIGTYDMTSDDTYYERGINLRHGYTTERYADDPEYLVQVPPGLRHIGVLLEPMSIVEKGITQADEIQRRLKVWRPRQAAVMGAGPIGLLAALVLRLRGLDVSVLARTPAPNPKSELLDVIGARYLSTRETALEAAAQAHGPFDLIFEATGVSSIVFDAAHVLGKNGVLVLSSITGGERTTQVQSDRLNLDFVLGNKVMFGTVNAHRGYFEQGVLDFALAEVSYPGWLARLLSHPVHGLENYAELLRILFEEKEATKAYLVIAEEA
jgi:threonine dehydrogenase-like Zn-dependent dehydrogenase